MEPAAIVGLLAVLGTSSYLLDSWTPDSAFSALYQLGKWLDLEGRVSQYAYSLLTGEYPDPSSTLFLLWTGLRFGAAALLFCGVTAKLRLGNWHRPYKLQLLLSLMLWLATVAYCVVWNVLAFVVGLIIATGTYFVIFYEDPVVREQRLRRETEVAEARRRLDALRQASEARAAETNTRAPNTTPSVVRLLVTIREPLFISVENVTNLPDAGRNPTPSSAATEATASTVEESPSPAT